MTKEEELKIRVDNLRLEIDTIKQQIKAIGFILGINKGEKP